MSTFSEEKALAFEKMAKSYLQASHRHLRAGNFLDSEDRDGDALFARENAYFLGLDATYCYRQAYEARNQAVTSGLDTEE